LKKIHLLKLNPFNSLRQAECGVHGFFPTIPAFNTHGGEMKNQFQVVGTEMADSQSVAADELRQFVERYEASDAVKRDASEVQKALMAELKGRGYAAKPFKAIIALRKMQPDDRAEQEAILEVYCSALGM
jgi:uncharacterized protein (UPF0335 family)